MSGNKKFASMLMELTKSTDHALHLISKITGEDTNILKSRLQTRNDIFQHLSYTLQQLKKADTNLHWKHNKEFNEGIEKMSDGYKLLTKGLLNGKKTKEFGTSKQVHELIKILYP